MANGAPSTAVARPSRWKAVWRAAFGLADRAAPWHAGQGGGSSTAGKTVTPTSSMELATVWACVRLLSETIGTLPLMLYDTSPDGARSMARKEPLFSLLHDAPSYDFTAVEFWEGMVLSLCLWGNAYALKERLGTRLIALTPLRCDQMQVYRTAAGAREYRFFDSAKGVTIYREEDILHVRGFGFAGDMGLSPITYARQSLGTAMAADEFAAAMFANGARPAGVLTVDQVLTPEQRAKLKQNVVEPITGSANAGGMFVLEAGMKFQALSMTPEDSQFLQTRAFHVEEICRWFRVPPFMVGHTEKSTSWGTGLEQQMIGFLTFALRPYLTRIEQAISRSLIPAEDRWRLKPEFQVDGLLRTDSVARTQLFAMQVQNGIRTRNEVRRLDNYPPMPGADELTLQSQNVPIGQSTTPPGERPKITEGETP